MIGSNWFRPQFFDTNTPNDHYLQCASNHFRFICKRFFWFVWFFFDAWMQRFGLIWMQREMPVKIYRFFATFWPSNFNLSATRPPRSYRLTIRNLFLIKRNWNKINAKLTRFFYFFFSFFISNCSICLNSNGSLSVHATTVTAPFFMGSLFREPIIVVRMKNERTEKNVSFHRRCNFFAIKQNLIVPPNAIKKTGCALVVLLLRLAAAMRMNGYDLWEFISVANSIRMVLSRLFCRLCVFFCSSPKRRKFYGWRGVSRSLSHSLVALHRFVCTI